MKIKGVSILMMIVFSLIGGDYNVSFAQVESEQADLSCEQKCDLECGPLALFLTFYLLCVQGCTKKCNTEGFSGVAVPDCNSSCGLIKYTGIYFFTKSFSLHF